MYHLPMFFLGPFLGNWTNRYGPRPVMISGAVILGGSLLLMSRMSSLWELYLLRTLIGIGLFATTLVPIQTTLSHWFIKRRGTALGLTIPGIFVGGLLIPPLAEYLIRWIGWRAALTTMGSLVMAGIIPPVALIMRSKPSDLGLNPDGESPLGPSLSRPHSYSPFSSSTDSAPAWTLAAALRTWPFWALFAAYFFYNGAALGLFLHLAAYATDLEFSPQTGALVVSLASGVAFLEERPSELAQIDSQPTAF